MFRSTTAITLAGAILAATHSAHADIRITNDRGGNLAAYQARAAAARASGERVVIDGLCGSACTQFLTLPAGQVCATPRGRFVFHTATNELGIPEPRINDQLLRAFPPRVRNYVLQHGGLWLTPISAPATAFVPRCR